MGAGWSVTSQEEGWFILSMAIYGFRKPLGCYHSKILQPAHYFLLRQFNQVVCMDSTSAPVQPSIPQDFTLLSTKENGLQEFFSLGVIERFKQKTSVTLEVLLLSVSLHFDGCARLREGNQSKIMKILSFRSMLPKRL